MRPSFKEKSCLKFVGLMNNEFVHYLRENWSTTAAETKKKKMLKTH